MVLSFCPLSLHHTAGYEGVSSSKRLSGTLSLANS